MIWIRHDVWRPATTLSSLHCTLTTHKAFSLRLCFLVRFHHLLTCGGMCLPISREHKRIYDDWLQVATAATAALTKMSKTFLMNFIRCRRLDAFLSIIVASTNVVLFVYVWICARARVLKFYGVDWFFFLFMNDFLCQIEIVLLFGSYYYSRLCLPIPIERIVFGSCVSSVLNARVVSRFMYARFMVCCDRMWPLISTGNYWFMGGVFVMENGNRDVDSGQFSALSVIYSDRGTNL